MRFMIKNITGDPTNANPDLWIGKQLYCCSDNLSNLSIINPGQIQSISSKAYEEIMEIYPQYIQLQDSTGADDHWAPFRADIALTANTWLLWDAGRMSGKWDITNTTANKMQFSFSGFTATEGVVPSAQYVSDIDAGETLQFWTPMNPLRYVYLFSAVAGTVQILVS